ncbi:butyrophilin subfamily 3 member A2-like [Mugil cephalus]|uniref:butyrophilin subfamily 3 member A2-like n=1 Tax=Mugil cephalus TaxID=48193 RepID=UPI001FB727DB|nr:butyrophilin subfamily 3 member A2-like [Mugil cephalus]
MVGEELRPRGAFTYLMVLSVIHSCRGQSDVVGPSQPIVALVGADIVLPCHLQPAMDASSMTVEWSRPDLDPRFVLVWRDSQDLQSKKHPLFRSRTSLFTHELKQGNISLKLSSVKLSDQGMYRCYVPALDRDATAQLVVGAASSPVILMFNNSTSEGGAGGGVVLQCESRGWYPEPEVLWLDAEGNLLCAGPPETVSVKT